MFSLKNYQAKIKLLFLPFAFVAVVSFALLAHYNSPLGQLSGNEEGVGAKDKNSLEIPNNIFSFSSDVSYEDFFPDFSSKLKVYLYEPRPDAEDKDKNFEVVLLFDNNRRKIVSSGEKLYLFYDNGYKLSDNPTDLWFSVCYKLPNIANVIIGAGYNDQNNNICKIERSFEITACELEPKEPEPKTDDGFLCLKNAIFLGPDLYLDICEKESQKSQLSRLLLSSNDTYFVKQGALLVFREGKWQLAENNIDTKDYSLFRVSSLNQNNLEIDYWKKGESDRRKIKLAKLSSGSALHISDDFITDLSIRTKKQVSCKIQGQRIILTEKDFLYKKDGKWKKGALDNFEKGGDLSEFFLFEKLELTPSSKVFIGYLFNHDKTQVARVEKKIVRKSSDPSQEKGLNNKQNRKRR